jgi:hypothetical protein
MSGAKRDRTADLNTASAWNTTAPLQLSSAQLSSAQNYNALSGSCELMRTLSTSVATTEL